MPIMLLRVLLVAGLSAMTVWCIDADSCQLPSPQCTCLHDNQTGGESVTCDVARLDITTNLKAEFNLRENTTTRLNIYCSPDYPGVLTNSTFGHLPQLKALYLRRCTFPEIPARAFGSLPSLETLLIDRQDPEDSALLVHSKSFKGSSQLMHLRLARNRLQFQQKRQIRGLTNLVNLDLSKCSLTDQHLGSIGYSSHRAPDGNVEDLRRSCLPKLAHLDLGGNKLTNVTTPFATIMPNLEVLKLTNNQIHVVSETAFYNLTRLTKVALSGNRLTSISQQTLSGLTDLTLLDLANNELQSLEPGLFRDLKHLKSLNLNGNAIGPSLLNTVVFDHLTALTVLELRSCGIQSLDFMPFNNLDQLTFLDLSGNNVSSIPAASLMNLPSLETLNISNNGDITNLTRDTFRGVQSLHNLYLSHNQISNIEARTFLPLRQLGILLLNDNRLDKVPRTRKLTKEFDLSNNRITAISARDFRDLVQLQHLSMGGNQITTLSAGTFRALEQLERLNLTNNSISRVEVNAFDVRSSKIFRLDLSDNKLESINGSLTHLDNLQYLSLRGNRITTLSKEDLPAKLKKIDFSHNKLENIAPQTFDHLSWLESVDVQNNHLSSLPAKALITHPALWSRLHIGMECNCASPRRPIFTLGDNPFTCNCNMSYLLTVNQDVHFGYVLDYEHLRCSRVLDPQVKKVSLSELRENEFRCTYKTLCEPGCPCDNTSRSLCDCHTRCPENCTCAVDRSRSNNAVHCSTSGLRRVPRNIPYSALVIRLDNNSLEVMGPKAFENNHQAKELFLNNSGIDRLSEDSFYGMDALEDLHLEGNHIKLVENNTFASLLKLRNLNLRGNQLGEIPLQQFDAMPRVPDLFLGDNPWKCDCKSGPELQKWITANSPRIRDISDMFCSAKSAVSRKKDNVSDVVDIASNGKSNKRVKLQDADFSRCFQTDSDKFPFIMVSVIFAVACFSGCVGLVIFNFRELIQVWLYARYSIRLYKQKEDQSKCFDAFISYSEGDESFVVHELLPRLEKASPKFDVCIKDRNWKIGSHISESIIDSVESSRRTILLLSRNFVESEWCSYEFKTAHQQVLRDKNQRLIVVVMDDKPPSGLDKDLDLYIQSHTFIQRKDPWFWRKLLYAMPDQKVRRPRNYVSQSSESSTPENLLLPEDMLNMYRHEMSVLQAGGCASDACLQANEVPL